ncbi:MAG: hypothetical protein HUJ26_16590 [Planctomycetaceae bacterium]|nr:hypothetical protein [Planctomycetaceae bacterium]
MSAENLSPESTSDSANSADSSKRTRTARRKRRRFLKFMIYFALLLAAAIAAAPEIIARTSLRNTLIHRFSPEYEGRVVLGATSLGWLKPISLQQLKLRHLDGETWAVFNDLKSEYTLLDLILEPSQLGHWSASQCDVTVHCEPGMTDVERWLLEVSQEQQADRPSNVSFSADSMLLTLKSTAQESRFQIADFEYRQTETREVGIAGEASVLTEIADSAPGSLDLKLDVTDQSEAVLTTSAFPLESLGPLYVRLGLLKPVSGTLEGSWKLTGGSQGMFALDGRGTARDFSIGKPDAPQFSVESLNLDLAADQSESGWTVSRLQGQTDFGEMTLDGTVSLPSSWKQEAALETLLDQSFAVTGNVSLKSLAEHFPGLITLQQEVELQQGSSSFRVESRPEAETPRLTAQLNVSNIVAKTPERAISWSTPLTAQATLLRPDQQWTIEQLDVESKAVRLTGRGNWNSAEITADVNLAEFLEEWSRIFDFGDLQLAGHLTGKATCETTSAGPITLSGDLQCESLVLGWTGGKPWNFEELAANFSGTGELDDRRNLNLTAFTTTLTSDRDTLTLTQQESDHGATVWQVEGNGSLSGLLGQVLATRIEGRLSGKYTLTSQLHRDPTTDRLQALSLEVTDFGYDSSELSLRESKLKLTGALSHDRHENIIQSDELILNCPTLAARLNELNLPRSNPALTSLKLAARGRIERLGKLIASTESRQIPTGMLNLQLSATGIEQGSNLVWKVTADDLQWPERVQQPATRPVSESSSQTPDFSLEWSGKGLYASADDVLTIAGSRLTADGLDCRVSGEISELSTSPFISLSGELDYEWAVLRKLYPELTGPDLVLYGKHKTPVRLNYPLSSPASRKPMSGSLVVAWDRGDWNSLPIGPAQITVNLTPDKLTIEPTQVTVSSGSARFGPSISRSPQGAVFTQPAERLLDQVQLTDEICHQWLKYVSPMTADAARVSGTFSVDNSKPLRIPLDHLEQTTSEGLVMIHAAKMTPGPLAMQFITLGKQIDALRRGTPFDPGTVDPQKPLMSITRQTIPYKVEKGRVYHQDLTMQISNLKVTSSGSVGFDDTLDIVAVIEIPDQWTIRGKQVRAIWGPAIQIPIKGSFARPQMDGRVIKSLLDKLVRGTVTNFLEQELNKQLNNLFKPK